MSTALGVAVMIAIECVALVVFTRYPGPYRLRSVVCSGNIVLVTLFGGMLIDFGFGVSNIGNIWYAAAVCSQCILLARHGRQAALDTLPMVYGVLLFLFSICWTLRLFPVVPGNEVFVAAVHAIADHEARLVAASFAAFAFTQFVLITVWDQTQRHGLHAIPAMLIATVAAQAVDTPIFFVIAFWQQMPVETMIDAMLTGFLVKCALGAAFTPAFVAAITSPTPAVTQPPNSTKAPTSVSTGR